MIFRCPRLDHTTQTKSNFTREEHGHAQVCNIIPPLLCTWEENDILNMSGTRANDTAINTNPTQPIAEQPGLLTVGHLIAFVAFNPPQ